MALNPAIRKKLSEFEKNISKGKRFNRENLGF